VNDSDKSPSTIRFPANSAALQSFHHALEQLDAAKNVSKGHRTIDIRIIDVTPLPLDTVYVTVERDLLKNLDEVLNKFGGGFGLPNLNGHGHKGKGKAPVNDFLKKGTRLSTREKEDRLRVAVRGALSTPHIVHSGDLLPLPLPSHPITYVPPPPARISFCEPVSQGLVVPRTKIVLVQVRSSHSASRVQKPNRGLMKQVLEDEAEDTSNEQFYSAAEDRPLESSPEDETTTAADDSDSDLAVQDLSDGSDDSLDDMISLSAPGLPAQLSEVHTLTNSTPRPGGKRNDGIHTPGSVFSNYTATTARQARSAGKVFNVQPLLNRIPSEALHPRPREEDDEDAFIFVDVNALAKIGCFSGDWVKIEPAADPQLTGLASLNLAGLRSADESSDWRPVKIYGLSGLPSSRPRYAVHTNDTRKSNLSQHPQSLTPVTYIPPILLHNLSNPKYLKVSPLMPPQHHSKPGSTQTKPTSPQSPPIAKEATLLKVSTPLSMDRSLQPALFAGLKRYFELKRRIVKSGDIVGISIDEGMGRATFSATKAVENGSEDDITGRLMSLAHSEQAVNNVGVAWFSVGHVIPSASDDQDGLENETWGGVAAIDSMSTRMAQAGSDTTTLPRTTDNTWEYWFGVKTPPKSNNELLVPQNLVVKAPSMFVPQLQRRLRELVAAATSPRAVHLGMKPVVILLTSTQRSIGKAMAARRACTDVGLHTFDIDGYDILTDGGASGGDVKTEAFLKARAERALSCGPECTALLIRHIEVLNSDRMISALKEVISDSRVILATTTEIDKVPDGVRSLFTHEFEMSAPDEKEREGILRNAVIDQSIRLAPDVDLSAVAVKTAALVAGDLVDVVERALVAKGARLEKLAEKAGQPISLRDVQIAGGEAARCVMKADFDIAVDAARKNFADAIGAPKIPNVTWDDVGGLTNVKDAVMETIQLPLERPELFAKGMKKRSGILFYGPPGTGKTLLAKAIATEFSLNFFSVKGPELLNMYIGESEANVRRVFQRARDARPCVVFFDELDSVAPKRGNQGDSGGVMDRIVSQLLAELDGMSSGEESGGGVFVIGATNRPDLLDAALLRPGRFDKMLYLGVSDTHEKQMTILEALTRKFNLHPSVSLQRVAEALPFTYTGADLYALCSDAMLKAITRQATAVDEKINALPGAPVTTAYFFDHLATDEDVAVMVMEEDFLAAQNELVGSVRQVEELPSLKDGTNDLYLSAKELEHFERVRRTFESSDSRKPTTASHHIQVPPNSQPSLPDPLRENASFRPKAPNRMSSRGKSKGKGTAKSINHFDSAEFSRGGIGDEEDEDDDDYVIKTDHLKVNGDGNGNGNGVDQVMSNGSVMVGKGKGKNVSQNQFLDTTAEDDEKMYS
jgi:peroxin-6